MASATDRAAEFVINRLGGYGELLSKFENSILEHVASKEDTCNLDMEELLAGAQRIFISKFGILVRTVINSFVSSNTALIKKELAGVLPILEDLKANATFTAICTKDYAFNSSERNKRITIMVIDAIMSADNVKNGTIGTKLVAEWRKLHPEKSFGGRRKKTRKLRAKKTRRHQKK